MFAPFNVNHCGLFDPTTGEGNTLLMDGAGADAFTVNPTVLDDWLSGLIALAVQLSAVLPSRMEMFN
jgi:hypothetical protein